MKQFYILVLLLLLATGVFAQRKTEFGFVVRAGNYTLLKDKQNTYDGEYIEQFRPGFTGGIGVQGKISIWNHLAFSAGLTYQHSNFSHIGSYDFQYPNGATISTGWKTSIIENSLLLPLTFYAGLDRKNRLLLSFGLVPSFNLATHLSTNARYEYAGSLDGQLYFDCCVGYANPTISESRTQILVTAGLHYRLEEHTTIGLEVLSSKRRNEFNYAYSYSLCDLAFFNGTRVERNPKRYPIFMKSLSISLTHNILR